MSSSVDTIRGLAEQDYKWGFVTEIDEDRVPTRSERRDHRA